MAAKKRDEILFLVPISKSAKRALEKLAAKDQRSQRQKARMILERGLEEALAALNMPAAG